jgi:hypothetical protein
LLLLLAIVGRPACLRADDSIPKGELKHYAFDRSKIFPASSSPGRSAAAKENEATDETQMKHG